MHSTKYMMKLFSSCSVQTRLQIKRITIKLASGSIYQLVEFWVVILASVFPLVHKIKTVHHDDWSSMDVRYVRTRKSKMLVKVSIFNHSSSRDGGVGSMEDQSKDRKNVRTLLSEHSDSTQRAVRDHSELQNKSQYSRSLKYCVLLFLVTVFVKTRC